MAYIIDSLFESYKKRPVDKKSYRQLHLNIQDEFHFFRWLFHTLRRELHKLCSPELENILSTSFFPNNCPNVFSFYYTILLDHFRKINKVHKILESNNKTIPKNSTKSEKNLD